MPENTDGTATCDRDATELPAYGTLHGLVTSDADPDTGTITDAIYCYVAGCTDYLLDGILLYDDPSVCAYCGTPTERTPALALVGSRLLDGVLQQIMFCHANGCSAVFLGRVTA